MRLEGMKVAILATDMFEESELKEPRQALEKAGAKTTLISPHGGQIQSAIHTEKGPMYDVDLVLNQADASDYDALLLPGGAINCDKLRSIPDAQEFVRQIDRTGKPMAVICHGSWLLISAGLVDCHVMTSYHTIKDDLINAGAIWSDEEVIKDRNWVTSRQPSDIPAFNRAMIALFANAKAGVLEREMAFRERLGKW